MVRNSRAVCTFVRQYGDRDAVATFANDVELRVFGHTLVLRTPEGEVAPACELCFTRRGRCREATASALGLCASHARKRTVRRAESQKQTSPKRQKLDNVVALPTVGQCLDHQQGGRAYQLRMSARGALSWRASKRPHGWTQWNHACSHCWLKDEVVASGRNWATEDQKRFKLCAKHARVQGCYQTLNPCKDCPSTSKKQAKFPDEHGNNNKLCAEHARVRGCHQTLHPCEDCPPTSKKQANFADEHGNSKKLCAEHARVRGCYQTLHPCEDCPPASKKRAHFADEHGNNNKLCAEHAALRGCHQTLNPCVDCPQGADAKEANFADEHGNGQKLCADHARSRGCFQKRNPCIDCPAGADAKEASFPDEDGRPGRLCSDHARVRGCYQKQNQCIDCPQGSEARAAGFPDESGRYGQLCAEHARARGCYQPLNPCEDCLPESKKEAGFADEHGNGRKLCSDHARARGCYQKQNPCEDCPPESKTQAAFADEHGNGRKLCAEHARARGCHQTLNPCVDCPQGADAKEAKFADEHGNGQELCSEHAFVRGLIPKPATGCSIAACRLWDRLETIGWKIQHKHFTNGAGSQGSEARVPGTRLRLDGYDAARNCVYEFHGNAYHGFPPGHPKYVHGRSPVTGRLNKHLYRKTMARMYFIRQKMPAGCRIFYAWEHEYEKIKNKPFATAASILHELPPGEHFTGSESDSDDE